MAGQLAVTDGAVVKFGQNAQLVVRDKLTAGKGVVMTSQSDDAAGGQAAATAQVPIPGAWSGLRFERSAASYGLSLSEMTIRYAGAQGGAGLTVLGFSPTLQFLQITDNLVGMQLLQGASPTIGGSSFLRNGVGILADNNSLPVITGSQFAQNSSLAIQNKTPASIIQATGNWWGASTGPKDPVGNPAGTGDAVSAGVNYGSYMADIPLLDPTVSVAGNPPFTALQNITLQLNCVNAVDFRIAENAAFTGVAFQPMVSSLPFTLSAGDGYKNISVQYRNATGATVTVSLPQPLLYDTQGPTLALTTPADGSYILNPITVAATATDVAGVAKVDFYLNGALAGTSTSAPYSYYWDTKAYPDGPYAVQAVATDKVGHTSTVTNNITKAAPPPDTTPPALGGVTFGGAAIVAGSTVTGSGTFTASVSDPSGVSSVEFLIDGASLGVDTNGADGYTAPFNILNVTDGSHTLTIRATDSLGNKGDSNVAITVAMAAPAAPKVTAPANNTLTAISTANVTGTAAPNVQIVAYNNAAQTGTAVTADATGSFIIPVALNSGVNLIQVAASNRGGLSPLSPSLSVTLDASIPAAPAGLTATAMIAGKIRLTWNQVLDAKVAGYNLYRSPIAFNAVTEAVKVNTALIPATTTLYDDVPTVDGTYNYRIVAVNNLGTISAPSNIISATSDSTLPKATQIAYAPTGKTDPATGRIAPGRVDVTVTVNEPLSTLPFLSIAPQGGTPVTVDLAQQSATVYTGFFNIAPGMPSGIAYAVFSARDMVGNRGTDIGAGASILIDAQGPNLTGIALAPAAPILNDATAPATVNATFTLDGATGPGTTPQISYVLSGSPTVSQTVTGLTQTAPTIWAASFVLPATAGQSAPENLVFSYSGADDLGNVSTTISTPNSFQVYQGTLPPLLAPSSLSATAQPAGKVHLVWSPINLAAGYQIYRQAPGETALTPYARVNATAVPSTEYVDATTADGLYTYAVASIRAANSQESLSGQSPQAQATADSIPPDPPQNFNLVMVGAGIQATWQAPASGAASYNLYRSSASSITSTAGLTPIISGIKTQLGGVDTSPSASQHSYAATAVDAAGNESLVSNSGYLNFALLPVSNLTVVQTDSALPVLSWTGSVSTAAIAGYDVYLGANTAGVKLDLTPLTTTSYIDTGYAGDERPYTVVVFDSNGVQASRSTYLPKLSVALASGTPILRNVMNRLQYTVTNQGSQAVSNARVKAKIGTREVASDVFSLAVGETKTIPVVVGGYADIPNPALLTSTVEIVPDAGELADIVRHASIPVQDGALVATVVPANFTRGVTGQVSFTLENTSDVDIELLTATGGGNSPSSEIRYRLLDKDGNTLGVLPFMQATGASVLTIGTGQTVARIPAHTTFTSAGMSIPVPSAAPDTVTVQLEVDAIRYHSGDPDQVSVPGLSVRQAVSLVSTPYYAVVDSISPLSSFGDQNIVITGHAVDRSTLQPLANAALRLYLNENGFERRFDIFSDGSGNFTYTFTPTATDGGIFKVTVVHPDVLDRPIQGQFVINSLTVSPGTYNLTTLRNYPYSFNINTATGPGTNATNLRVVYDPASQPTGSLPTGVTVTTGAPVTAGPLQNVATAVTITGDNSAAQSGSLVLKVMADELGTKPVATVLVNYAFTDGHPALQPLPTYVETGVSQGGNATEQVVIQNQGYAAAEGVTATLVNSDGTPAPSWIYLAAGNNIGTINVGDKPAVDIVMTPDTTLADGIYNFKLRIAASNATGGDVPVYVSLTQSGIGNALFKASDIYTGTLDSSGQRIAGLAGATITLQNEMVPTVSQTLTTDSLGEAYFTSLPSGSYKFRAIATNHQELIGRVTIKPGITVPQDVFLDYNLVSVEWSVTPIVVQDTYTITALVTFVTNVPAPVVLLEPAVVNLPQMQPGDVFMGEFKLTNYGLVRADHVVFNPPPADAFFRYEFMATVPTSLEAHQTITIPYRVVSLTSLNQPAATATGGGCNPYSAGVSVPYDYTCANGTTTSGNTGSDFSSSGGSCGGGSGGSSGGWIGGVGAVGGGSGGTGGGGSGPGFTGGGTPAQSLSGAKCVPKPCDHCSGNGGGK